MVTSSKFESTSSLFIEYTKDYPNFLIDNDTKYRVGEHPKKEDKDMVSTSSVSTIHSSSSEGEYIKRSAEKDKGDKRDTKKN